MELIDEYFKRDLTEEEERLLAEALAASPETAELFAGRMADFYGKELGAQAPPWPGGNLPLPRRSLAWILWILGAILALGGFLVYQHFHRFKSDTPMPSNTPAVRTKVPSKAATPLHVSITPATEGSETATSLEVPLPNETPESFQPGRAKVKVVDAQGNEVQSLPDIILPTLPTPTPNRTP